MAKIMGNLTRGTKKQRGVSWFPEIVDKRMYYSIHFVCPFMKGMQEQVH